MQTVDKLPRRYAPARVRRYRRKANQPQALADAGVNGKPADPGAVARLAAQVRQTLAKPEDT